MTKLSPDSSILIKTGYQSGIIGAVALRHAEYYAPRHNFGLTFEARVASEMSDYFLNFCSKSSQTWSLWDQGQLIGSITLDGTDAFKKGAHLRWFILDDKYQGQKLGSSLLDHAIDFAKEKQYPFIYLDTIAELKEASRLYQSRGFKIKHQQIGHQWGEPKTEQVLHLDLMQKKEAL